MDFQILYCFSFKVLNFHETIPLREMLNHPTNNMVKKLNNI